MPRIPPVAALAVCLAVLTAAGATAAEWTFEGCEAGDIRSLVSDGSTTWASEPHGGKTWSFLSAVSIRCDDNGCKTRSAIELEIGGEPASPVLKVPAGLPLPGRVRREMDVIEVRGDAAMLLLADKAPGTYRDGAIQTAVFTDYGRIAEIVRVRVRTEVRCHAGRHSCEVRSDPVVFVPYGRDLQCGSLAAAK